MPILALSTFLTACSALQVDMTMNRFDLPETNGLTGSRAQLNLQAETAQTYKATQDASRRPPDLSAPNVNRTAAASVNGNVSLAEKLDFSIKTTIGRSPTMFALKYQLLGASLTESKKGDWSLAVSGAYGFGSSRTNGDQNGDFGPGGYGWDGRLNSTVSDVAVLAGNRLSDTALFYGSIFYSNYRLESRIRHSQSDNGSSPAAEYNVTDNGFQRGANLGFAIMPNPNTIFKIEGVYSDLDITPGRDWSWGYGASVGWRF